MAFEAATERERIVADLRAVGRPEGDPKLQAYIGSPYPVLGLSSAQFREAHQRFRATHPHLEAKEVNSLAAALWSGPTSDEKMFAIGLLTRNAKVLDERSWALADRWVDEAIGWALSDGLASGPISLMAHAHPERFAELLRWTKSDNFWRRRASTYAMNEWVRAGELDKPFRLLERLLYDEEFWVQRAVGTWLRESWKQDQPRTEAFLRKHAVGLPRVTITVATERATKAFREELRRRAWTKSGTPGSSRATRRKPAATRPRRT